MTSQTQCRSVEPGVSQKLGPRPGGTRAPQPACFHLGSFCRALPRLSGAVAAICSPGQRDTGDLYNLGVKRLLDLKTYHLARVRNAAVYMVNIVEEGSVRGHGDGPCECVRVCVCEYNPLHMHSNPGHGTVLIEDQEMYSSCRGIFLRSFSQLLVWSSVSGGSV